MGSEDDPKRYNEQVGNIQGIFARFDHESSGRVKVERIPDLLNALGRDGRLGKEVVRLLASKGVVDVAPFEDVVKTLKVAEEETQGQGEQGSEKSTPLTLLKRLQSYKRHCEKNGDYVEAQKAGRKYSELRAKEEERQRTLVAQAQTLEMGEVEGAQKSQFLEFSSGWDRYMADYESTAYMSLERLKEQHAHELAELAEKMRNSGKQCKASRELLELRRKEAVLAKLGKYEDAHQVKEAGDQLEEWELARNAAIVGEQMRKMDARMRGQQQRALQALLKRIQRDRGEQIRHRQTDSQRLIQRNKNLKSDLGKKQHLEYCRADAAIRSILSQPDHAQKLLDENDPAFVARSAAMGELPSINRARLNQPAALPENYNPPGGISRGVILSAR